MLSLFFFKQNKCPSLKSGSLGETCRQLAQNKFGFKHRAAESLLCGKTHVRSFEPSSDLRDAISQLKITRV